MSAIYLDMWLDQQHGTGPAPQPPIPLVVEPEPEPDPDEPATPETP